MTLLQEMTLVVQSESGVTDKRFFPDIDLINMINELNFACTRKNIIISSQ